MLPPADDEQERSAPSAGTDQFSVDFEAIYSQDTDVTGKPHGWIQWKGTEVCIDLHCACGGGSHFDGGFFYNFECPYCHAKYAVGQNVVLIQLTADQASRITRFDLGLASEGNEVDAVPANESARSQAAPPEAKQNV
jgi:hypothetical protein